MKGRKEVKKGGDARKAREQRDGYSSTLRANRVVEGRGRES